MSTPDNVVLQQLVEGVRRRIADLYARGSKDNGLDPSFKNNLARLKVVAEAVLKYLQKPNSNWFSFINAAGQKEQRGHEIENAIRALAGSLPVKQKKPPSYTLKN